MPARQSEPRETTPGRSLPGRRDMGRLPGGDGVDMLKRQANVVEAFEKTPLAKRVDREWAGKPRIVAHRAGRQIDMELVRAARRLRRPRSAEEFLDILLREADRNHAILEAVVEKDVGEGRCDHHLEAVIGEGPGGMFAA